MHTAANPEIFVYSMKCNLLMLQHLGNSEFECLRYPYILLPDASAEMRMRL
jgi:hypothetical protein